MLVLALVVAGCYVFVDRPAAIWARGLDPGIVALFNRITVFGGFVPYLVGLAVLYLVQRFLSAAPGCREEGGLRLQRHRHFRFDGRSAQAGCRPLAPDRPLCRTVAYGFAFFKIGYDHNSFPSGHATTAWAVACALTLLYPRLRVLWIVGAALVAASRVIIGEHYPGDVLAGAWFGVVVTLALSRTAWFREVFTAPASAARYMENRPRS